MRVTVLFSSANVLLGSCIVRYGAGRDWGNTGEMHRTSSL